MSDLSNEAETTIEVAMTIIEMFTEAIIDCTAKGVEISDAMCEMFAYISAEALIGNLEPFYDFMCLATALGDN